MNSRLGIGMLRVPPGRNECRWASCNMSLVPTALQVSLSPLYLLLLRLRYQTDCSNIEEVVQCFLLFPHNGPQVGERLAAPKTRNSVWCVTAHGMGLLLAAHG